MYGWLASNVKNPSQALDAVDAEQNYRQHRAYPGRERGVYERVACLTATQSLSGVHRRAELQQRLLEAPRGELRHGALLGQLVGVGVGHLLEVVQVPREIM